MMSTLRAEWIKLVTVRAHFVLLAFAAFFPFLSGLLVASLSDIGRLQSAALAATVVGAMSVSAVFCGALGAAVAASEYSHNLSRVTFAATPHRARVHVARLVVMMLTTFIVALFTAFGAWLLSSLVVSGRGQGVSLTDRMGMFTGDGSNHIWVALFATSCLPMLLSGLGIAIGTLLRSTAGSIVILIVWVLMGEPAFKLFTLLIGASEFGVYAPYSAAWASVNGGSSDWVEQFPAGLLWCLGFVLGVFALAVAVDSRRDA